MSHELGLWIPNALQGAKKTPPEKISEVLSRTQDPMESLKREVHGI